MWHLVLAMLQACLAWHFQVCGQPLTDPHPPPNILTVKATHTQERPNFPSWLWIFFWFSSNLPPDMVGGIAGVGGRGHIECLLGQFQIFRGQWITPPSSIECLSTKLPGMHDLRARLARVKAYSKVKPQAALSEPSCLSEEGHPSITPKRHRLRTLFDSA